MASGGSVFGDDINSTPISKIQLPPVAAVQSKGDAPPLQPPIYKPEVATADEQNVQKQVTFDDTQYVREIPARRKKRSTMQAPWAQYADVPPLPPPPKKNRVLGTLMRFSHHIVVFALFVIALWYHAKLAAMPYIGTGYALTIPGILAISLAAAGAYGIIESIVD